MNLIDLFWNLNQDNLLLELKKSAVEVEEKQGETIARLEEENRELQLRVGVLIRLLIDKGVFSAGDYADQVNKVKIRLQSPSAPPFVA